MNIVHCVYVSIALFSCVSAFSWNSCGTTADPVKVMQLDITQDKQTLLVNGRGKSAVNITSPIKGKLIMKKKMFWGWTTLPCFDGIGSCNYDDVCKLSPYSSPCPRIFTDNSLPCQCPILQGSYSAKKFPIELTMMPKWMEKGHYLLRAFLTDSNNQELICLEVDITIT